MLDCLGREIKKYDIITIACGGYQILGIFIYTSQFSLQYYWMRDWEEEKFGRYISGVSKQKPHISYINAVYSARLMVIPKESLPDKERQMYDNIMSCLLFIEHNEEIKRLKRTKKLQT